MSWTSMVLMRDVRLCSAQTLGPTEMWNLKTGECGEMILSNGHLQHAMHLRDGRLVSCSTSNCMYCMYIWCTQS